MIESTWIFTAAWIALAAAAATGLLVEQPWRPASPARSKAAWTAAAFAGFWLAGVVHLLAKQVSPWHPSESSQYLLMYVAPLAAAVQLVAGLPRLPRWLALALRVLLVVATPPLLLLSVIENRWTAGESVAWCAGLSAAMGAGWLALANVVRGDGLGRGPWLAMGIATGFAGATLMASGSVTLGQFGLALGLAMFGAWLGSAGFRVPLLTSAGLGVAWILLASLLIQGCLLANLGLTRSIALALLPLVGGFARLPELQRKGRWWPAAACLVVAMAIAAVIAVPALVKAMHDAEATSSDSEGY